jgi:FkbM family methyltransferase
VSQPAGQSLPPIGMLRIKIGPKPIEFTFPNSGNMRAQIEQVLSGREYPLARPPGYEPKIIVDVGANVGSSAVFFHTAFPAARIYCYEPSAGNFRFLKQNVAFSDRIVPIPYGLLDRDGTARLFLGASQAMQHSLIRSVETTDTFEEATFRRASTELDERAIADVSILKLDTEGSELAILRDLGPRLKRVDFLYVEYHSEEDRRAIDKLLEGDFTLGAAHAIMPHRGMNTYLSRALIARFPQFDRARIAPPAS